MNHMPRVSKNDALLLQWCMKKLTNCEQVRSSGDTIKCFRFVTWTWSSEVQLLLSMVGWSLVAAAITFLSFCLVFCWFLVCSHVCSICFLCVHCVCLVYSLFLAILNSCKCYVQRRFQPNEAVGFGVIEPCQHTDFLQLNAFLKQRRLLEAVLDSCQVTPTMNCRTSVIQVFLHLSQGRWISHATRFQRCC